MSASSNAGSQPAPTFIRGLVRIQSPILGDVVDFIKDFINQSLLTAGILHRVGTDAANIRGVNDCSSANSHPVFTQGFIHYKISRLKLS